MNPFNSNMTLPLLVFSGIEAYQAEACFLSEPILNRLVDQGHSIVLNESATSRWHSDPLSQHPAKSKFLRPIASARIKFSTALLSSRRVRVV